jgi:hypothetical protein
MVSQLMMFSKTAGHFSQSNSPISRPWTPKEAMDGLKNVPALKKKDNINEFKPFVPFEIRWILLVPSVLKYRGATFEMGECKGYLLVGFVKTSKSYGCTSI